MERWQRSNRAGNEDDPKGARNTKRTEPPPRGGVELSPIALRTFADDLRAQASRWLARADDLYATADRWESFLNDEGALSDELKKVSALVQQGAHRR